MCTERQRDRERDRERERETHTHTFAETLFLPSPSENQAPAMPFAMVLIAPALEPKKAASSKVRLGLKKKG